MAKAVIGLSGGVDSAVAAHLLQKQNIEVSAITLKMFDTPESEKEIEDARAIAQTLGVHHEVLDYSKEFKDEVIGYFVDEYMKGKTPNPCLMCNRKIKFDGLYKYADRIDAQYVATGHYAKVIKLDSGRFSLLNLSNRKDQTYALSHLSQNELGRTLMPLSDYDKDTVRSIAEELGLIVAQKKDSQDICFIPDGDYAAFIRENVPKELLPKPGNFVDEAGNVIGTHTGYTNYTIGQRKGLNIAKGHRVFVKEIIPESDTIVISDEDIYGDSLTASNVNMMGTESLTYETEVFAKVRYAHKGEYAKAYIKDDVLHVKFDNPVRAITPGQSVVLYNKDEEQRYILLSATINK